MHKLRRLSYAKPSHTGSPKEVKSFTLAASASTNIKKVQEIGTLCLLRAAFGKSGCKQIDLNAQFWSPHSFAWKPSTSPLSNKPCPCSFTSHPSLTFCTCFLTAFQNVLWPPTKQLTSNHHTLLIHTFACVLLAPKTPFSHPSFSPVHACWKEFFLLLIP